MSSKLTLHNTEMRCIIVLWRSEERSSDRLKPPLSMRPGNYPGSFLMGKYIWAFSSVVRAVAL